SWDSLCLFLVDLSLQDFCGIFSIVVRFAEFCHTPMDCFCFSSRPSATPPLTANNMASHFYHKDSMDQYGLHSPSPPKSPLVP
ncbi:hypothetical protein M9458_026199, partial [Cirrhinus mrigala]